MEPTTSTPVPVELSRAGPTRLCELTPRARLCLAFIVLAGALLRVAHHWERSLAGDEIGTLYYLKEDFGLLLTEFRPWLTMNFYIAGMKALSSVFGQSPWVLALPSLLAGVAVPAVLAAIVLRLSSARLALLAAFLAAVNPFLAFYSCQLRSYMLQALFALLAVLAFLDWQRAPSWRLGWGVALALAAEVLMQPNGAYLVVALALLAVRVRRLDRRRSWSRAEMRTLVSLAVPVGLALVPVALAYAPILESMAEVRERFAAPRPTSVGYLPDLFEYYFGGRYSSLITALLLGAGVWSVARREPRLLDLTLLVITPVVCVSMAGFVLYPWSYARYLIPILPFLLVLIAHACLSAGRVGSWLLTGLLLVAWWPGHAHWFAEKRDRPWDDIAAHLTAEVGSEDWILAQPAIRTDLSGQDRSYEARFLDTQQLAALPAGARPFRLFVLLEAPFLESAASQTFGVVQVATLSGTSGPELASRLVAALASATGGRNEGRLATHYRQVFELNAALGRELEAASYLAKHHKCAALSFRERMHMENLP